MPYEQTPLDEKSFLAARRTVLLGYPDYAEQCEEAIETFEVVTRSLADSGKIASLSPNKPMVASKTRAVESVTYLHLQYSAGLNVEKLQAFFPDALCYWEEFAKYDEIYDRTAPYIVAHLTLGDDGYWRAIRLTSFAILLGFENQLHRLCAIWDYGNQPLDGLLERLVAPYVPGRAPPPDECTRHLPYFKLLKVFAAEPDKRPALMAKYMDEWYTASRREPYYDSIAKGREHSFVGLWAFEAAAVTRVLHIDDASYRDHEFYPKDLADFARSLGTGQLGSPTGGGNAATLRGHCDGGDKCPRAGFWFTPAQAGSRRYFKAGEVMPKVEGDYGLTIWQWDEASQEPPKL